MLAAAVVLLRCTAGENARVIEIASPAGAGAAEAFLSASKDGLLLSWLEPVAHSDRTALRFARFDGERWSAPRTIVERNDLFVNWADFPSIVEDGRGALFAHWLQKSGAGKYAYDVRMATSTDGGATWLPSFLLNRDGKEAEHGFVTLAALPMGGAAAAWLDGRTSDMTLRFANVSARGEITNDVELDARTCECCTTGMAMTRRGPVIVYRDRSSEEMRDISYVRVNEPPKLLHRDGWKIEGCPVNGPQIDARDDRAVVAWFTGANGSVHVAWSDDSGGTFNAPVRVDDGKPVGRVDVVLVDDDEALVTWLEQSGEIRARYVERGGRSKLR